MSTNPLSPGAIIDGVLAVEGRLADFIANGPSAGLGGHVRDQYRKRCNQFANAPGWAQALTAAAGGGMGRICEPYWDDQGTSPPTNAPPFIGGQCPDVYLVSTTSGSEVSNIETFTMRALGPIGGARARDIGNQNYSVELFCSGLESSSTTCGGVSNGGPGWRPYRTITSFSGNTTARVNSATACGSDNCGNLPSELEPGPNPPPDPGPTPGPEPTDDPSNPTGTPLLPIPDYEDPIGGPTPIVGPSPETPTLDPTGIPGPSDSQEGSPDNVGEPIEVDPGVSGGGDGTDFGIPPAGKAWIGCLLRFTIPVELGAIAGSGPTQPVSPRVFGNASLVFAGGLGTAHRCNSASISLVRPSGALKVTGVYVNVAPGFTYTISPVSIDLCPENTCGA